MDHAPRRLQTSDRSDRLLLQCDLMEPILNHTRVTSTAAPSAWLYLLHGIFGSGRNWGSVARRLVDERPEWGVVLVDLRLHGGSVGFTPPHTVERCSADLLRLEEELGFSATALLGHSYGGKIALHHARDHFEGLRQVWVMDSTLRTGEPAGTPWEMLGMVRSLPDFFATREELVEAMVEHGHARGVGQWLGMNLERKDGGFRWKLDWDGVEEMLRDYFRADVWPVIDEPPPGVEIDVVRATESSAVDADAQQRIARAGGRTGRVHLHEVQGGHWLNVDNADAVLKLLTRHLPTV
jgi:esterase